MSNFHSHVFHFDYGELSMEPGSLHNSIRSLIVRIIPVWKHFSPHTCILYVLCEIKKSPQQSVIPVTRQLPIIQLSQTSRCNLTPYNVPVCLIEAHIHIVWSRRFIWMHRKNCLFNLTRIKLLNELLDLLLCRPPLDTS